MSGNEAGKSTKGMDRDEAYMREALRQARKAARIGEAPIGCVIVHEGRIIARGYNKRNQKGCALAHAEILAIRKASKALGDWRLEGCTLYVTLEPCQMCAGAIIQARVARVVIGTMNPKAGCAGSVLNLLEMREFNHQADVRRGVLREECGALLTGFFQGLREGKRAERDGLAGGAAADEGPMGEGAMRDTAAGGEPMGEGAARGEFAP